MTDLGAAPGSNDKYRDENFYLGYDRGDNKYAEDGFAVGGRGQDMVLDLAGDENVSIKVADHDSTPGCSITATVLRQDIPLGVSLALNAHIHAVMTRMAPACTHSCSCDKDGTCMHTSMQS